MNEFRSFPAKIILFGEYSVLIGSDALGIPFNRFSGRLSGQITENTFSSARKSNQELRRLMHFLEASPVGQEFDLRAFRSDLNASLWFDSSIPGGYGMGSSGALCAAIFHQYGRKCTQLQSLSPHDLNVLKSVLSAMESLFHGSSSGFDPLISYAGCVLLLSNDQGNTRLSVPVEGPGKLGFTVSLTDSGQTNRTGPSVSWFLEQYRNSGGSTQSGVEYSGLANACISDFLRKDTLSFRISLAKLSHWQYAHLRPLIPDRMAGIWLEGLESGKYMMKLCGSGNGGYNLVFSETKNAPPGALNVMTI